jgi:hypothetical protein
MAAHFFHCQAKPARGAALSVDDCNGARVFPGVRWGRQRFDFLEAVASQDQKRALAKGLDTAWSGVLCMFRHTQGGHPRETVHVAFPKALRLS